MSPAIRWFEKLKGLFKYQRNKARRVFIRPIAMVECQLSKAEYDEYRNRGAPPPVDVGDPPKT